MSKKKIHAKSLKAALDYVNNIFTLFGEKLIKKLPPGVPGDADSCPIANALSKVSFEDVSADQNEISFNGITLPTPKEVAKFIGDFDDLGDEVELPDDDTYDIDPYTLKPV